MDWKRDLDRAADSTKERLAELAERQKLLLVDAGARLEADGERLSAESEAQREALTRLRADLDKSLEDLLATARTEVEGEAAERRRALHELEERMRRREKELMERIEREEVEAAQRIRSGFEDVQRRQIEQLARTVERATATYADEGTQQFAALVKSSREDAARRLARELDRAVGTFAREAEVVLAERLAHVGDAGAQRLERRLADAAKSLERQRDEWMSGARRPHRRARAGRSPPARGAGGGRRRAARGARSAAPGAAQAHRRDHARPQPVKTPLTLHSAPNKPGQGSSNQARTHGVMSESTEILEPETSERSKVESWRLHVLIEAGYPLHVAERLAASEADLHVAVELVGQGCTHATAAEILL